VLEVLNIEEVGEVGIKPRVTSQRRCHLREYYLERVFQIDTAQSVQQGLVAGCIGLVRDIVKLQV